MPSSAVLVEVRVRYILLISITNPVCNSRLTKRTSDAESISITHTPFGIDLVVSRDDNTNTIDCLSWDEFFFIFELWRHTITS